MKLKSIIIVPTMAALLLASCGKVAVQNTKITNETDSLSYAFGVAYYNMFMADSIALNPSAFARGMYNTMDEKAFMTNDDATAYINAFAMRLQEKAMAEQEEMNREIYAVHIAENEAFLAKNGEREDVITTASGLQYEVIKMGNGPKPTGSSTVSVHYTGTTIDGEVFDSSVDRGTPAEFPLNGVITGWSEGLQLMPVGSKFKLYLPADLAYGANGAGGAIEPFSTLIFEVELLKIVE